MKANKRARKPAPFTVELVVLAKAFHIKCCEVRKVEIYSPDWKLSGKQALRLSQWLKRAALWAREGKR